MSDTIEHAREGLEHAEHAAKHGGDGSATKVAVLIAALAAALALSEMGEKGAQNEYLSRHIEVSDVWAQYQAKGVRATQRLAEADILDSMPNADQPAVQARAKSARDEAARLRDEPGRDGAKQLSERAHGAEMEREHAFHVYHQFERVVGALQIAIVLASVSIVTRVRWLTVAGAAIGGAAAVYGALIATGVV